MNYYCRTEREKSYYLSFVLSLLLVLISANSLSAKSSFSSEYTCAFELLDDSEVTNVEYLDQGENPVFLESLIGVPCYPSPNNLVVCGLGDTIPIMLYTKATDTIYDITINVEFEEGLEYASFAYVHDPFDNNLADIDTINVDNPESPTFRLNELSQSQGAVVLYVGVRAVCEVDYDIYSPQVKYTISYQRNGSFCTDEFKPNVNYSSNILTPDLNFVGTATPSTASFTGFDTDNCITTQVAASTPGAGLVEALLTVANYGYELSNIFVNGEQIPASDISIDPTTGVASAFIDGVTNPNYWGADGQLTFNETIDIQTCFRVDACTGEEYTPTFSVQSACAGEICGGSADFISGAIIREGYTWNTGITRTFTNTTEPSFCDPTEPSPYTFELSLVSNNTNPVEGDLYNLLWFTDACPSSFLSVDTVQVLDAPSGNVIGFIPLQQNKSILSTNGNGRVYLYLRNMDTGFDPDGTGGLEDIDGDGVFDDLPAGTPLYLRVEMLPSCSSELLACGSSGGGCDFTQFWWQGSRNCGINTFSFSQAINDGIDEYANTSTGQFENLEMFNLYSQDREGYNIEGTYSSTNPLSEPVQFSYELGANDFASCPSGGPIRLQVQLAGNDTLTQDIELSNIIFNGSPATIFSDYYEEGLRIFIIDAGSAAAGNHTYTFDVNFDYQFCAPRQIMDLQALVIQDCDGCDCVLSKACDVTVLAADPANPAFSCTSGRNKTVLERITTGYTGRDLSNQLTTQDVADNDKTRLLPGDVIKLNGWIAVDNPVEWNNVNRSFDFQVIHLQNSATASRSLLTSRLDMPRARLQSFTLKRENTGENFDLGAIPIPGDFNNNANGTSGAWTIGGRWGTNFDQTINHPGISNSQYIKGLYRNSNNDHADQAYLSIYFGLGEQVPNDQPAVQSLFEHIDGAFELGDTIFIEWTIPIMSTPRFLADGSNTIQGTPIENGHFRFDVDGRSWNGSTSSNLIGTINNDAEYEFYEPLIRSERRIELSDNGCRADVVHTFSVANPPPADWFEDEFRPIIGIEDIEMELPREYFTDGDMTVTHYDQPSQVLTPDSTVNLIPVQNGNQTSYLSCAPRGKVKFIDAEKKDGLRANDYKNFDTGDDDISLTGGTFPMLGVGLNPTGTLAPDSLQFKIPLRRACNSNVDLSGLSSVYNASYPDLADYNMSGYYCNQGQWYGFSGIPNNRCQQDGLGNYYWPYDRETNGNPHHLANDSIGLFALVGEPQINFTASGETFSPSGPLVDAAGTENFNYELNLTNAIPGGILVLRADLAFDLISIDGNSPILVTTTDSTNVYYYDLGARASGPLSLPIVSNLSFCEQARLLVSPVLGCTDSPNEVAQVVAAAGKSCNDVSINYISGLPELETTFLLNPTTQLCVEEEYTITFINRGTTDFIDFFPTIYLPTGMEFSSGDFSFALQGAPTTTALSDPTENTAETGVDGIAYQWTSSTFPDIPIGSALAIYFRASTSCNSVLGKPIAALVEASVACNRAFESTPQRSAPIMIADTNPAPNFTFDQSEFPISCGGNAEIILTTFNTGKALSEGGTICLTLPSGISIDQNDISFVAPQNASVSNFTGSPIGAGGAQEICFDAPPLMVGGFLCMKLVIDADLDCGKTDIAVNIRRNTSFTCATTGQECEVQVSDTPEQFITLEVNPPIAVDGTPSVVADCASTGTFDLNYDIPIKNISGNSFGGNTDVELYFDADGSGELEADDVLLGSNNANISLDSAGTTILSGIVNVPETQACKLILRVTAAGCLCSEILIPIDEVKPKFVTDIGTDIVLCPSETYDIELGCGSPVYGFEPAEAGTTSLSGNTLTISLNAGFGVSAPVEFFLETSIGTCSGQRSTLNVTQLESFTVADKSFDVCSAGCQQLDLGIDINLLEDLQVSYSPSTYLETPTTSEPIICNPTADINYTATFTLNGGQCTTTANFAVQTFDPPTLSVVPETSDCRTLGFTLSDLINITPGNQAAVWESRGDGIFDNGTDYHTANNYIPGPTDRDSGYVQLILKTESADTLGNNIMTPCGSIIQRLFVAVIPCFDFGDLPDTGAGTGAGNYETGLNNQGPRHMLIPGLSIGATADFEDNGQPDNSALGDGNDEDGFGFSPNTSFVPGNTINIPLNITNTTDSTAYLVGWIDWNGDGEFDPSEEVVNESDDGMGNFGMTHVQITIPTNIQPDVEIGVRFRLSNEDGLSPNGLALSGEVEDYLIRPGCTNVKTCNVSVDLNIQN